MTTPAPAKEVAAAAQPEDIAETFRKFYDHLQFEARELESAKNSKELLEQHVKATGGKIMTRFPPEPNGFLHIGHCKAMTLSFGYADHKGGCTYLRYDDTNPEKEEKQYFDTIRQDVEWMGFKPFKTTFTCQYFQEIYDFAIKMIKEGKAFVDFSTKEEIQRQRNEMLESPYRNKPVEWNLKEFEKMRCGLYKEGEVVLRCKIDMKHPNPNMRDFIAYRIKYCTHIGLIEAGKSKDGRDWCIYPTYDFTHCIVDSLENITHSLCTLEFEIRRDSYYWLLEALNIYRPHVWEFSRLNVSNSRLSKRFLNKMIAQGIVGGFDDPRLLTIAGLKRRGYSAEVLKHFCVIVGISRNENKIPLTRLEQVARTHLDTEARRCFAIIEPLEIEITNFPEDKEVMWFDAPNHPKFESFGSRKVPFTKKLFIEDKDFKEVDEKSFFGLAPNKEVGLRYGPNIKCTNVIKNAEGKIVKLQATVDLEKKNKPKGHIHWLCSSKPGQNPPTCEVRLYDVLFYEKEGEEEAEESNPQTGDDWSKVLNLDSETKITNAMIEEEFFQKPELSKVYQRYQFERLGYFVVDQDTKIEDKKLVFNRIVTLKESVAKFANLK